MTNIDCVHCEVDCIHCHEMIESGNDRYSIYYCDWYRTEAKIGEDCYRYVKDDEK